MKKIKNICCEFISTYFNECYGSLLSGSFVDGNQNEYSDVDLIIFISNRDTVFNETIEFSGYKIQAIIIPVQRVQEILWVDYITSKGSSINMFSKGHILSDTNHFLLNLKKHCINLEKIGALKLSVNEEYMLRVRISSLIYDIRGIKDVTKIYFTVFDALDLLVALILRKSGRWCGEGKHKMRQLKEFDEKLHNRLIKDTQFFFNKGDRQNLLLFLENEMDKNGGLVPYYSKGDSLLKVSSDNLTIELIINNDLINFKMEFIKIHEIINQLLLELSIQKSYFFISKPFRKGEFGNKIYIVISAKKKDINIFLLKKLNEKLKHKKNIPKILYPLQFDPEYEFYSKNIYNKIAKASRKLSSYIINNNYVFDSNFQIHFSLSFCKEIKSKWFTNDNDFIYFLDYIYKCWLPSSYDNSDCYTTVAVIKNIKQLTLNYHNIFLKQIEKLKELYTHKKQPITSYIVFDLLDIKKVDLEKIPEYKLYLLDKTVIDEKELKKWVLYKDITHRILSVALIDSRLLSYIPYVVKKLEKSNE